MHESGDEEDSDVEQKVVAVWLQPLSFAKLVLQAKSRACVESRSLHAAVNVTLAPIAVGFVALELSVTDDIEGGALDVWFIVSFGLSFGLPSDE